MRAIAVRRGRHGRPALHDAAPADRARERSTTQLVARLKTRLRADARSAIRCEAGTLVGPLIDERAFDGDADGARRGEGGRAARSSAASASLADGLPNGYYVQPALVEMPAQTAIVQQETFAPILYVLRYRDARRGDRAAQRRAAGLVVVHLHDDLREAERFMSAAGSDCGIANVNIGPSGAEIGGAFGGEKETGGGRESGSDAWKAYMRRADQHDQLLERSCRWRRASSSTRRNSMRSPWPPLEQLSANDATRGSDFRKERARTCALGWRCANRHLRLAGP